MSASRPLRLLGDDLTGALDSAAAFASQTTPVPVLWGEAAIPASGSVAFDSGTREVPVDQAAAMARRLAPMVWGDTLAIAYKKIDSLLRGSQAAEISAVLQTLAPKRCVVAPAFSQQFRVTRGGRHGILDGAGGFHALEVDLASELEAIGHSVTRCSAGQPVPEGVSFWDADSDADLDAIVAAGAAPDAILWVGSAGLAGALARRWGRGSRGATSAPSSLKKPLLTLLGTNHAVTLAQLALVTEHHLAWASPGDAAAIQRHLERHGAVFVTVALPNDCSRQQASGRIAAAFANLVGRLPAPATLFVSGGETLRGLCEALGCTGLNVMGEWRPGIAWSSMAGGAWDGTEVVSKSGAFGTPDLFGALLAGADALPRKI